jgi:hypothetical protein
MLIYSDRLRGEKGGTCLIPCLGEPEERAALRFGKGAHSGSGIWKRLRSKESLIVVEEHSGDAATRAKVGVNELLREAHRFKTATTSV